MCRCACALPLEFPRIRPILSCMKNAPQPNLTVRVDPNEMVQYVHDLMTAPHSATAPETTMALAHRQWGGDTPLARAAQLRWSDATERAGSPREVAEAVSKELEAAAAP